MLFSTLEIITIAIITPIDFMADPISLKNTDKIFFPIFELSIFPFIAELIKSFASMSKFSSLYLFASSIKSDIPHRL